MIVIIFIYLLESIPKQLDKMEFITRNYSIDVHYMQELVTKYGTMGAAKLLSESLDKSVDNTYIAGTLYAMYLREKAVDIRSFYQEKPSLFNDFVNQFVLAHYDILKDVLVHERDYGYQFAAVKTIAKNYLFKYKGEPIESIQWAWMRIAVQVAAPDDWKEKQIQFQQGYSEMILRCKKVGIDGSKTIPEYLREVLETYEILSRKEGIHATPTCINSGYCIPQLESCFLARIGDNMLSIADIEKLLLMGSKCNGGFGVFMGDIRHSRVANRGITKGVPGLAKMINAKVPYADQLGSRPMAVTLFLPIWHCDTPTFIRMKDENSPLDIKATLLNYALCIPDLFRKRCLEGGNWSLFCPRECKIQWVKEHGEDYENTHIVDNAPSLCDVWGEEFEKYYLMCEKAGIAKQVMKARDLDAGIHTYRCMIGEPYLFYTDNVNRKSNHSNIGTIVQSNLCVHGDTLILTEEGYIPIRDLEGEETNIWNGEQWSTVIPVQTGKNQHLLSVKFSNGSIVKCTPYHKFYIKDIEGSIEARDLKVGYTLPDYKIPVLPRKTHKRLIHKEDGMAIYDSCISTRIQPQGALSLSRTIISPCMETISDVSIVSIEDQDEYADTFCFNEPKRHMGIFNGIIAGNCTEIVQATTTADSIHGEMVATCDLATINVASLVRIQKIQNGDTLCINTSFDWKRLGEIARQFTRNLDRVLDRTSGVIPNKGEKEIDAILADGDISPLVQQFALQMKKHIQKDPTYNARKKTRAIGVGIMGLASAFSLMGYEYGSKESFDLGTRIRACIYYHTLDESANLASNVGIYPLFDGSPLSKGILSHDLWKTEVEYMEKYLHDIQIVPCSIKDPNRNTEEVDTVKRYFSEFYEPDYVQNYKDAMKRYTWKEVDPVSFGISNTWDDLRMKVKKGVRNSLTTCQMPNATTSGAFGVSASIEPFYEMYFAADNANGKDTTIYDALRDVFIAHGVYEPERIASFLYKNKGRITGLHRVFDGDLSNVKSPKYKVKQLENLFPNAFSINKKKYLLFIQRMGHYIDQAQSTNHFFDKPNAAYLARLSFINWINGAKTEYYLRRIADTEKINPFMNQSKSKKLTASRIVPSLKIESTISTCRRDDPNCVSCQ